MAALQIWREDDCALFHELQAQLPLLLYLFFVLSVLCPPSSSPSPSSPSSLPSPSLPFSPPLPPLFRLPTFFSPFSLALSIHVFLLFHCRHLLPPQLSSLFLCLLLFLLLASLLHLLLGLSIVFLHLYFFCSSGYSPFSCSAHHSSRSLPCVPLVCPLSPLLPLVFSFIFLPFSSSSSCCSRCSPCSTSLLTHPTYASPSPSSHFFFPCPSSPLWLVPASPAHLPIFPPYYPFSLLLRLLFSCTSALPTLPSCFSFPSSSTHHFAASLQ
jgi:hypothetical protein